MSDEVLFFCAWNDKPRYEYKSPFLNASCWINYFRQHFIRGRHCDSVYVNILFSLFEQFAKELKHAQDANAALKQKIEVRTEESYRLEHENTSFKVQLESNEKQIHVLSDEMFKLKNAVQSLEKDNVDKDEEIVVIILNLCISYVLWHCLC